jgi:pyruvate-ferredoxin/flavodoxin oxidoreductase
VYVARVAMGASDAQTLKACIEAESYDGPSLIIAYSHCIAHGFDLVKGLEQQDLAVKSGFWPLLRFDPRNVEQGKNPLMIDSKDPTAKFEDFAYNENRFRMLLQAYPDRAEDLMDSAIKDISSRWNFYKQMAAMHYDGTNGNEPA